MGFLSPTLPDFDLDAWRAKGHHDRVKALAQDWALHGFGTPYAVYLLYLVKLACFVGGAVLVISLTPGAGSVGSVGAWWSQLVVYEKVLVWTLLWEILGLGCGSLPLTLRFLPPIGGFLYWLRPGTMRLAPWPGRVPLTAGTRRRAVDVALYAAVLLACVALLLSGPVPSGSYRGALDPVRVGLLLGALALIGLRDKAVFLAARPEQYATMLVVFLFPVASAVFALKLVMMAIWWGAATSKLNRHFPFVVAVMISNTPWQTSTWIKRRLWRGYPEDLRPGWLSQLAAHGGTVVEYTVPLVLLLSRGGAVTAVAVIVMIAFHTHITSTFPLGVPLEWNLFVIYSLCVLFWHDAHVGPASFHEPLLAVVLVGLLLGLPALGNVAPRLVSFLPSMRYYAGNWATSIWLFRKDGAEEVFDAALVGPAAVVAKQLTRLYGEQTTELLLYKGLAFRALHSHGRGLTALLPRAVDVLTDYDLREGEVVAGVALGWNFGDGHLHGAQLLAAVQERCHYGPGQLRVITLESQPIQDQRQAYQILDAADGLLEEGYVKVSDMVSQQPWLDETATIPVQVRPGTAGA